MEFSREVDLGAIIFNALASAIPKWQIFKLLRSMQYLHNLQDHEILYSDRSLEVELLIRPFLQKTKNTNMAGS
jgi:hypothetical protein